MLEFTSRIARCSGVALLSSTIASHAAFGVAHDAAVAGGIGELGAENRGGGFAAAVRIEQSGERFGAQQRRVARNHDRELRALANRAPRDLHGVAGAALRLLHDGLRAETCSATRGRLPSA